jgi:hypothetical protein
MSTLSAEHVAVAVVVASGLFEHAMRLGDTERGWQLARMAADAIDHTQPHPVLTLAYRDKPVEQTDAAFLAANLPFLEPVAPAAWPKRKVRPNAWGEYTRVMRGLDEFFGATPVLPKDAGKNRAELQAFVAKHIHVLDEADRARVTSFVSA